MSDMNARNRQIKKLLTTAFGAGKVSVKAVRGSMCYGLADAYIAVSPRDNAQRLELERLCIQLLSTAGIDLGSRYTDDTCTDKSTEVSVHFSRCTYYATKRHDDGSMSVLREYGGEWEVA